MDAGSEKIKILIADDHAVVREGTRQILENQPDMTVVAEASDGEEAVRLVTREHPDVAIIDVAMPRMDGIAATRQIKTCCPEVAVLILTAYDDDQFIFSLLEAGAAGYLLKSVRGRELVDAVRQIHAGESVLDPAVTKKVLNKFMAEIADTKQPRPDVLSAREMEVIELASKGLSNQEIADRLFVSLRTVQSHIGHIFNKLNVSSRTEAVVRALKEGWITLDDIS